MKSILAILFFALLFPTGQDYPIDDNPSPAAVTKWLRTATLAAPEFKTTSNQEITNILADLEEQGVNAVDIDFSYDPLNSQINLINKILKIGRKNHPAMKFFVYQAPLEKVSENVDMNKDGKVDPGKTSFYQKHPAWAQRGFGNEPALFYGANAEAFWVGEHDEDIWLCPNDPEYKEVWTNELAEIAKTGVDGIYIDVPFLRGYFDDKRGWLWACTCPDCQRKYFQHYGEELPERENWNDSNFRRFVQWRFEQTRDFLKEARAAIKKGNPKTAFIVEHWNCINDALEYGLDPATLASVSDVRAHEWTNVNGSVSDYHSFSWFEDMVRYLYYRSVDGKQPAWLLAYADEDDSSGSKALAALQFTAGLNFWETEAPDMAGSVDVEVREDIFTWINKNKNLYYRKNTNIRADVGLYYSRASIIFGDYRHEGESSNSFQGFIGSGMIMLQEHIPFKVITSLSSSLKDIKLLILADVSCLSNDEVELIEEYVKSGGKVIITAQTGIYDEQGNKRGNNALARIIGKGGVIKTNRYPGSNYYLAASPYSKRAANKKKADKNRIFFSNKLMAKSGYQTPLSTDADSKIMLLVWEKGKTLQIRGYDADEVSPKKQNIKITYQLPSGRDVKSIKYYSWLYNKSQLLDFTVNDGAVVFVMPLAKHGTAKITLQ